MKYLLHSAFSLDQKNSSRCVFKRTDCIFRENFVFSAEFIPRLLLFLMKDFIVKSERQILHQCRGMGTRSPNGYWRYVSRKVDIS